MFEVLVAWCLSTLVEGSIDADFSGVVFGFVTSLDCRAYIYYLLMPADELVY